MRELDEEGTVDCPRSARAKGQSVRERSLSPAVQAADYRSLTCTGTRWAGGNGTGEEAGAPKAGRLHATSRFHECTLSKWESLKYFDQKNAMTYSRDFLNSDFFKTLLFKYRI